LIVIVGQNYQALLGQTIDWYGLLVSYIGIPVFLAFYLGYKWTKKTKLIPLDKCELDD
jgi:lysine-specific permease